MSTIELSSKEYMQLVDAEEKLNRLESAGVDNWEGYSIAMSGYTPTSELYQEAQDFLNELALDTQVDYPAGREAGHQVIFNDEAIQKVVDLFKQRAKND